MLRILLTLCLFILLSQAVAQVWPKEGSSLNYRIVGFKFPEEPHTHKYEIQIADGKYNSVDSFTKNIAVTANSKSNRLIVQVPAFGRQYTWRVIYGGKNESALHHFETQTDPHTDTTKYHLRILQPAEKYKDSYVSVDAGGVIYDMNGHPVWFLPETNDITGYVSDLKFTSNGTITFICKNAYEINYNGDILWKGPNKGIISGDTVMGEFYHHEFTRLSNGHYMVLGQQKLMCKSVKAGDSTYVIVSNEKKEQNGYKGARFGTIIEYDERGNVVWSWLSSKYLIGSDFDYYESRIDTNERFDPHDNAFFFDEKNKCIYLGFRNLNRIIKIEYPGGKVSSVYGDIFKPGVKGLGAGLFCNQHNIGRSQEGYLYFFNNNSCRVTDSMPSVILVREPVSATDTFKKVWEYVCTIEDNYYPKGYRKIFGSGGNAVELPDRSMFVCMGSEFSKMFIVNRDKKVLWSALPERYMETDEKWTTIHEYRANIISRQELEKLIWSAETANEPGE